MRILLLIVLSCASAPPAAGGFVLPSIGGGQVTMQAGAPMKHAAVGFDGQRVTVHVDDSVTTPLLRPLIGADFDPAERWGVLIGKDHNFQYGWVADGAWAPQAGLGVYVQQLSATPGLETYEGGRFMSEATVRAMTFAPLFADGEPWRWTGVMTHNAYAVDRPMAPAYEATYRVFLADTVTLQEPTAPAVGPLYGDARVTFAWTATPVPAPGAGAGALSAAAVCVLAWARRR